MKKRADTASQCTFLGTVVAGNGFAEARHSDPYQDSLRGERCDFDFGRERTMRTRMHASVVSFKFSSTS